MSPKFGAVIGSALWDLSLTADRRPEYGDTALCGPVLKSPGGKGLNQAVALRRLDADLRFLSAVGLDSFGEDLREYCIREGLDPMTIYKVLGTPTGLGVPVTVTNVGKFGFASPGASLALPVDAAIWFEENIGSIAWILCHFETSKDTLSRIIDLARRAKIKVYVNAAPKNDAFLDMVFLADVLIVNSSEASWLFSALSKSTHSQVGSAAERLRIALNIGTVIITAGAEGAMWATARESGSVAAVKVQVVDPIGAGDAFCAGLVHALEKQGNDMQHAMEFASTCAALAVTARGAANAMPLLSTIEAHVARTTTT